MEAKLHKIHRLRANQCCILGERVGNVNDYDRLYLGIVVGGRRFVYINAGPPGICDGGSCCWGVLYDPATGRFFDLAFNGIA